MSTEYHDVQEPKMLFVYSLHKESKLILSLYLKNRAGTL